MFRRLPLTQLQLVKIRQDDDTKMYVKMDDNFSWFNNVPIPNMHLISKAKSRKKTEII